jgi:phage baseplate assembly protein W
MAELARIEVDKAIARWEPRVSAVQVSASRNAKNETDLSVSYKVAGKEGRPITV